MTHSYRFSFKTPTARRKPFRRYTPEEVEFIIANCTLGPVELQKRLPHLSYEQIRYVLQCENLLGRSAYTRTGRARGLTVPKVANASKEKERPTPSTARQSSRTGRSRL